MEHSEHELWHLDQVLDKLDNHNHFDSVHIEKMMAIAQIVLGHDRKLLEGLATISIFSSRVANRLNSMLLIKISSAYLVKDW